jgi:hypothetical protein
MNKIEDYLHLYIGHSCSVNGLDATIIRGSELGLHRNVIAVIESKDKTGCTVRRIDPCYVKPILRPLSDMTEEEKSKISKSTVNKVFYPEEFLYLLKQGFDLFGLIESGLAITKTPAAI